MSQTSLWSYERNSSMKVFSRLFVGIRNMRDDTAPDPIPLGFATPYEENAAGRKRQETVNTWASRQVLNPEKTAYVRMPGATLLMDNIPASGFKITDDVKRVYWGGGNVVWRIEDPRGFELEIQSNNLMAIIQSCGVDAGGTIPGNCIWGRSGGDNILLHENSAEYKDAVKAAETLKAPKQVSKANRQVSALYRLVNGSLGIFIGKVHVTVIDYEYDSEGKAANHFVHRITLPGGQSLEASSDQSMIKPSVEYDAVLEVMPGQDGAVLPSTKLKLYKKAPLVDNMNTVVPLPEINNAFLWSLDWEFASSAVHCYRILSVTVNPILNPEACLVKLPEARYKKKIASIMNSGKGRRPVMYHLVSYKGDEAAFIDDVLCGSVTVCDAASQ